MVGRDNIVVCVEKEGKDGPLDKKGTQFPKEREF